MSWNWGGGQGVEGRVEWRAMLVAGRGQVGVNA